MVTAYSLTTGVLWAVATRWSDRLIGVMSIAILARLLTPEQFGLVATANIVAGAVGVFFSFGFDWALVRLPVATHGHYSTAWSLRICIGLASAAILCAVAWPVGIFFEDARLAPVVVLIAMTTVVAALENPAMAEFRRNVNFRAELLLRLAAKIAPGVRGAIPPTTRCIQSATAPRA